MPVNIDFFLLLAAATTFFIGGLLKGAMGFGLPFLAIPVLTIVSSLPTALSIAVPPAIAANLWQIWKFREYRKISFLKWFLGLGAVGLLIGAFVLKYIENAYLEILLGVCVLLYLLASKSKSDGILSSKKRDLFAPMIGSIAGLAHGSIGLSGMVGPTFFQAAGLARPSFIFAVSTMFTMFAILHLPALAVVGLFQFSAVLIGALVIAPTFLGLWLGEIIGKDLDADAFSNLVKSALMIAAILPIWNGISKLLLAG